MGSGRRVYRMDSLTPLVVVLLGLLIVAGILYGRSFLTVVALRGELSRVEGEIAALELRNEQLQLELERLTSPEHLEEVARRQLGLVKPGETVFYIAEPSGGDGP